MGLHVFILKQTASRELGLRVDPEEAEEGAQPGGTPIGEVLECAMAFGARKRKKLTRRTTMVLESVDQRI